MRLKLRTRNRTRAGIIAALALVGAASPGLWGATTDTQVFTVTVPATLAVAGPLDVTITHDQADTENSFTSQAYTVDANASAGAAVTFAVSAPFIHATATTYKRNVRLTLAVSSSDTGSGWATTTATDLTDYAAVTPDNAASVRAASTAAGNAALGLTVGFVTSDFSTLAAGNYSTTVTATLVAN